MTDFHGLSWDELSEHWPSIATQMRALRAGPRNRWRRFRLLEIYAQDTNELIGEVIGTSPGPILLYRGGTDEYNNKADAYMPVKRSDDMSVDPVTGADKQVFELWGRRNRYTIMGRDIVRALSEKAPKLAV